MQARFNINKDRAIKLLTLDPNYHREPKDLSEPELLSEFIEFYLKPLGLEQIHDTEETVEVKTEAPVEETPEPETIETVTVTDEPELEEPTEAVPQEEPEPEIPEENPTYPDGLRLLEDDGQLKCQVHPFDLKMDLTYPGGTCTVELTDAEYDEYYRIKKESRRKIWETGVDRTVSDALIYLIGKRKQEGNESTLAGLKAVAEAYLSAKQQG